MTDINTSSNPTRIRLAISHGDINGISYEVIIKALSDPRMLEFCTPIIYGSPKVMAYHRKALKLPNVVINTIKTPSEAHDKRVNIINCIDDAVRVELGKSTSTAGESSYLALERASEDLKNGEVDVLVTAPINKKNIQSEDFEFPGHTEYLQNKFEAADSLMFLVSENLRVGVVTGHIPLSKVSENLTKEAILNKLRLMNRSLIEDFGIDKPKIGVLGLNPHAGDNGLLGSEEEETIIPAIEAAKAENILAIGPYPADGIFGGGQLSSFDGILAMYHDQGLAPFKALAFERGVNFTAGLSAIRTSPDHGTAFEIAGENIASETSMREAIFLACSIFRNRQEYKELVSNPLKVVDKSKI